MKKTLRTTIITVVFVLISSLIVFADNSNTIVYKTKYGQKYHTSSCHHIKNSKYPIVEMTLYEAVHKFDLDPCSVCNPPILNESSSRSSSYSSNYSSNYNSYSSGSSYSSNNYSSTKPSSSSSSSGKASSKVSTNTSKSNNNSGNNSGLKYALWGALAGGGAVALFKRRNENNNAVSATTGYKPPVYAPNPPATRPPSVSTTATKTTPPKPPTVKTGNTQTPTPKPTTVRTTTTSSSTTPVGTSIKPTSANNKPKTQSNTKPRPARPDLYVGMIVAHKKYGAGTVTDISKDRSKITVTFPVGEKRFISDEKDENNAFKKGYLRKLD